VTGIALSGVCAGDGCAGVLSGTPAHRFLTAPSRAAGGFLGAGDRVLGVGGGVPDLHALELPFGREAVQVLDLQPHVADGLPEGLELLLGPAQAAHELAVVGEQLDERPAGSDAPCTRQKAGPHVGFASWTPGFRRISNRFLPH